MYSCGPREPSTSWTARVRSGWKSSVASTRDGDKTTASVVSSAEQSATRAVAPGLGHVCSRSPLVLSVLEVRTESGRLVPEVAFLLACARLKVDPALLCWRGTGPPVRTHISASVTPTLLHRLPTPKGCPAAGDLPRWAPPHVAKGAPVTGSLAGRLVLRVSVFSASYRHPEHAWVANHPSRLRARLLGWWRSDRRRLHAVGMFPACRCVRRPRMWGRPDT